MTATQADSDNPKKMETPVKDQKSKQKVIMKGQTAPGRNVSGNNIIIRFIMLSRLFALNFRFSTLQLT